MNDTTAAISPSSASLARARAVGPVPNVPIVANVRHSPLIAERLYNVGTSRANDTLSQALTGPFGYANSGNGIGPRRNFRTQSPAVQLAVSRNLAALRAAAAAAPGSPESLAARRNTAGGGGGQPRPLPTTYSLFAAGFPLQVYLLTHEPSSSDPTSWFGNQTILNVAESIVPEQLGVQEFQGEYRIEWPDMLTVEQVGSLWGVGVAYEGYGLFAWPLEENSPPGRLVIDVFVSQVQGA